MAQHNDLGNWGEDVAEEYMRANGWYIRNRDWHFKGFDIDLVCIDEEDTTLIFVEVKTRSSKKYSRPSEAVDHQKRKNIITAAEVYRRQYHKENRIIRYDIISVTGTPLEYSIEHITDAFSLIDLVEQR